eukprot:jgi/Chlat1/6606/Chrsp46S06091
MRSELGTEGQTIELPVARDGIAPYADQSPLADISPSTSPSMSQRSRTAWGRYWSSSVHRARGFWQRNTVLFTRLAMVAILAVALAVVSLVIMRVNGGHAANAVDELALRFRTQLLQTTESRVVQLLRAAEVSMTLATTQLNDPAILPYIDDGTINTTICSISWMVVTGTPYSLNTCGYVSIDWDAKQPGSVCLYRKFGANGTNIIVMRSKESAPGLWYYQVADANGHGVGPVQSRPVEGNYSSQPWFPALQYNRTQILWIFTSGILNKDPPFFQVVTPLYQTPTATRANGIFALNIDIQTIKDFLFSLDRGHGDVYIITNDGLLISASQGALYQIRPDQPSILRATDSDIPSIRESALFLQNAGVFNSTMVSRLQVTLNTKVLMEAYYLDAQNLTFANLNLIVVLVLPRSFLLKQISNSYRTTIIGLSFMAVGVLLVGCLLVFTVGTCGVSREVRLKNWLSIACQELDQLNQRYLRAKQDAEAATEAKSAFLSTLSHELRTPLTGVLGFVDILLTNPDVHKEHQDCLRQVEGCSITLLQLLNDLLDMSKITSGKLELEESEFNLVTVLEGVVDMYSPKAQESGVELVLDLSSAVPEHVVGDEARVRQIFLNLVSNSVKFTKAGHVVVRGNAVEAETVAGNGARAAVLCFSVDDTGIGIPADRREAVFEPFVQVDATSTRQFGGTGLGLPICKNLLALMGGDICIADKPPPGTRVEVKMPVKVPSAQPQKVDGDRSGLSWTNASLRAASVVLLMRKGLARSMAQAALLSRQAVVIAPENVDELQHQSKGMSAGPSQSVIVVLDTDWPMDQPCGQPLHAVISDMMQSILLERCVLVVGAAMDGSLLPGLERIQGVHVMRVRKPLHPVRVVKSVTAALQRSMAPDTDSPGRPSPVQSTQSSPQQYDLHGLKVLLAEDNVVNQKLVCTLLRRQGAEVTVVGDGAQAVAAVAQQEFDVVFMDGQMPVKSGYEATKEIRHSEKGTGRHLPIVALTAHAGAEEEHTSLSSGLDAYLVKPISVSALYATAARYRRQR